MVCHPKWWPVTAHKTRGNPPKQIPSLTEKQLNYFWSKVDKSGDCWAWTGYRNDRASGDGQRGYGYINLGSPGMFRAHRVAWTLANGPIPGGLSLDHICHNRICVKPSHLRLATKVQNMENRPTARKDSKSGVRGVRWVESIQRWRGVIYHNKVRVHDRVYRTLGEAEEALNAKRREIYTHYSPPQGAPDD